jgi:hypothetical protein
MKRFKEFKIGVSPRGRGKKKEVGGAGGYHTFASKNELNDEDEPERTGSNNNNNNNNKDLTSEFTMEMKVTDESTSQGAYEPVNVV